MPAYQIRDWSVHFENNKSKERDRCSYVCVPNKQHGMGFCRLMAEPDGASIYGIWHCILGACSQQKRPREGWLTSDGRAPGGHQAGTAWAPEDLALKFRRPVTEIVRAFAVLCSESVGWMVCHGQCPPSAREVPAECPPSAQEGKGMEGNGKKGREGEIPDASHPTLKEVKDWASGHGVIDRSAQRFFDHYQGKNLWLNQYGRPVDWKHLLVQWANRDREETFKNGPPPSNGSIPTSNHKEVDRDVFKMAGYRWTREKGPTLAQFSGENAQGNFEAFKAEYDKWLEKTK